MRKSELRSISVVGFIDLLMDTWFLSNISRVVLVLHPRHRTPYVKTTDISCKSPVPQPHTPASSTPTPTTVRAVLPAAWPQHVNLYGQPCVLPWYVLHGPPTRMVVLHTALWHSLCYRWCCFSAHVLSRSAWTCAGFRPRWRTWAPASTSTPCGRRCTFLAPPCAPPRYWILFQTTA